MELLKPKTVSEAIKMLADSGAEARILAGGTDLVPRMNRWELKPKVLISIREIGSLRTIREADGGLLIGSLATHADLADSPLVYERCPSLAAASAQVGSPLIRNLGTLGGNLCWASPAADTAPPLLSLGAQVLWNDGEKEHRQPLESFFVGVNRTSLPQAALVTGIFVPAPSTGTKTLFVKLGLRNALTIAVVSVAAAVEAEEDGLVKEAQIALGSVAAVPLLARKAARSLIGRRLAREAINQAAELAVEEASPISDIRASGWYREEMIRVYTRRVLFNLSGAEGN